MEEPVNVDCIQTTEESVGSSLCLKAHKYQMHVVSSISGSGLRLRYKS